MLIPYKRRKKNSSTKNDEWFQSIINEAENKQNLNNVQTDHPFLSGDDAYGFNAYANKERTQTITEILQLYRLTCAEKFSFQVQYRPRIFWGCSTIITLFTLSILGMLCYTICNSSSLELPNIITIITIIVSLIISILELVHTIVKYCFPEKDDEYIVKIVETIQSNDLATLIAEKNK